MHTTGDSRGHPNPVLPPASSSLVLVIIGFSVEIKKQVLWSKDCIPPFQF